MDKPEEKRARFYLTFAVRLEDFRLFQEAAERSGKSRRDTFTEAIRLYAKSLGVNLSDSE